ncbi:MAG: glycine--tRNA ligase subunit beta [Gammaproteobacteria bacterium]|jgi:glycyl-tRNA synthetase beta chain|nr:glycine--tRNA ligase subunit beta [Gammaproteobacteria bacterium]
MKPADLLVEIGTEELPPKALRGLMDAFAENLGGALDEARLEHGDVHAYASPRRLAVIVDKLSTGQEDRRSSQKGPPVSVAYDDDGNPLPPATAFAKKCGVGVADLQRIKTDKGEWLAAETVERGKTTAELLPALIEKALADLPIPRRMRWGAGDAEFVRPVHWIVVLHGTDVVDGAVMGIACGNTTMGHRFHSRGPITVSAPSAYLETLEREGRVVADFDVRRELVRTGAEAKAKAANGHVVDGEALYDEVAALVEWPVPVLGSFDEAFLELPREVVVSTLTGHQRYFPIADDSGALLPSFVTVANLESKEPDKVRDGNERVIRPRLADAAFFWDSDRRKALTTRREALRDVVYQRGLGSLYDKSSRTAEIAAWIAERLGLEGSSIVRAAELCKCDLLTGMVGEFPDLQGTMGRYYAISDGESDVVAEAIGEHYQPRFAGDALPATEEGRVLAMADKLDTLAGIFTIGKKPSGNRDPFGLRRSALGVIRLSIECGLDLDLKALIEHALELQPAGKEGVQELAESLYTFISDRLRRYFLDRDPGLDTETFDAVMARQPSSLVDFELRLQAVQAFLQLDESQSLASANKRIANILRQAEATETSDIDEGLLEAGAERALYDALVAAEATVRPLLDERNYTNALRELAALRGPVDRFFDDVMVMADEATVRSNRLALLAGLRALFLDVADISRLSVA